MPDIPLSRGQEHVQYQTLGREDPGPKSDDDIQPTQRSTENEPTIAEVPPLVVFPLSRKHEPRPMSLTEQFADLAYIAVFAPPAPKLCPCVQRVLTQVFVHRYLCHW